MTKFKKRKTVLILSLLLLVCISFVMCLNVSKVNAESTTRLGLTTDDEEYSFASGGSVNIRELSTDSGSLRFEFDVSKISLEDLRDDLGIRSTWWGITTESYYAYTFTAYKYNGITEDDANLVDVTELDSIRIMFAFSDDENKIQRRYSTKKESYELDRLEISPSQISGEERTGPALLLRKCEEFQKADGFTCESITEDGEHKGLITDEGKIFIALRNISPFSKYFVRCTINKYICTDGGGFFGQNILYSRQVKQCDSQVRSIATVLQNMEAAGKLDEDLGPKAEIGREIIRCNNVKRVRIRLLEQIGDTPFATSRYEYVNVPVVSQTVYLDDVLTVFNVDTLKCLGSNSYGVTYDEAEDTYNIYYLENVWTRSITTDGKFYDYFLDINKSYRDFYYPYVVSEVMTQEMYEWIFSTRFLTTFPELVGYRFDNVFGYYGFLVIPEAHTLNTALVEMFGIETNIVGAIKNFSYEDNLEKGAYMKLLDDYHYGWLSKAWEGIIGELDAYPATYYVVYSEPGTESAFIGEGGQQDAEDPNSAITENVVKPVTNAIAELFSNIEFRMWFFVGIAGVIAIVIIIAILKKKKEE